jgi:two-component system NtrC family response regulator
MNGERKKLLIVEDDPGVYGQLQWYFEQYEVLLAEDKASAISEVRRNEPVVVTLDLGLPPDAEGTSEGLATLQEILKLAPKTKIIVVTGNGDQESAVRAVGLGAYDFYQKPIDVDLLDLMIQRAFRMSELEEENHRLHQRQGVTPLDGIISASESMLQICRLIEKVADTGVTVLLCGESGTGKELLARAIHKLSSRVDKAFIAINCAAIPENLLESELFGYEKGAFTGAVKQTAGKIEYANGGTLFLDEIGDMPLALQAKLLRFLQERVVERVGGRSEIPVDVRVVCATNQDLGALINKGMFRQDLYFRISEVIVTIPPLRQRGADSVVLARAFLSKYAKQHGRSLRGLSDDAVQAIQACSWPGNVRELENRIKGAAVLAEGTHVTAHDLALDSSEIPVLNLKQLREQTERQAIQRALVLGADNISKSADLLGITRPTLYHLMHKYGLTPHKE